MEMGYCVHVEPKQIVVYVEEKEKHPKFHRCSLKELIGCEDVSCVGSFGGGGLGVVFYTEYKTNHAERCPMFTANEQLAEKMRDAVRGLRQVTLRGYMTRLEKPVIRNS
jgi:hypothetical protein